MDEPVNEEDITSGMDEPVSLPLPNVPSNILGYVVEYLSYFANSNHGRPSEIERPVKRGLLKPCVTDWEWQFIEKLTEDDLRNVLLVRDIRVKLKKSNNNDKHFFLKN